MIHNADRYLRECGFRHRLDELTVTTMERVSDVFVVSVQDCDHDGSGIVHAVFTSYTAAEAFARDFAQTCCAIPGESVLLEGFILNEPNCDADEFLTLPCTNTA